MPETGAPTKPILKPSPPNEVSAGESWEFPGWGCAEQITDLDSGPVRVTHLDSGLAHKLGVWKSTAICGNDITSSCLYVSALCAIQAGPWAPVALAIVAAVLYLFRSIYAEVGSALPLNGGAYNVLLNTTTKARASVAACLTILSYIATAVISAYEAMHYAGNLIPGLPVILATVGLLGLFALLNIVGMSESGSVAVFLFVFHIVTLSILVFVCGWAISRSPEVFGRNWALLPSYDPWKSLFFGFAAATLGISGFESSANFIEEQAEGAFPLTLRNMWIAVAVFNPLISLMSLGLLPVAEIAAHKEGLLAEMGMRASGNWLGWLVSVDAVLVLSGAVLTSYVGVTGLIRRLSLDRCLPQVLLSENSWRNTNHWIIIGFFLLCCSILAISGGKVELLAGVYTLSFLGVMLLFAVGNMMLKVLRARLPRDVRAPWPWVILAFLAVLTGLVGNVLLNPEYVGVFTVYFLATLAVVGVMLLRLQILYAVLASVNLALETLRRWNRMASINLKRSIRRVKNFPVVYFSKGDNLEVLNRVAQYVLENEHTNRLKVVHCYENEKDIPATLADQLKTVDRIYPKLRIDLVTVKGRFGPEMIERLSRRLGVPKNYMFIGTPGDRFPHELSDLGGVRLVM